MAKNSTVLACIDQPQRPSVSEDQATALATCLFGLQISDRSTVKELESYNDRNFYMRGTLLNAPNNEERSCGEYILKILNPDDTACASLVEAQCEAMMFLRARGYECSTPIVSVFNTPYVMCKISKEIPDRGEGGFQNRLVIAKANSSHVSHEGRNASRCNQIHDVNTERALIDGIELYDGEDYCKDHSLLCAVRLLTFVPGRVLKEIPLTTKLLYEVGKTVGRLDRDLKELSIPTPDRSGFLWDLSSVGYAVESFLGAVSVARHREMVREVCARFREEVTPRLDFLPKQFIHGDSSYSNIVVNEEENTLGFIDFADFNHSCRVFELAISLMYIINAGESDHSSCEPINMAGCVFAGYQSVNPLSEMEIDLLYLLTASRFCQSLVYGAYTFKNVDPGNEYLLETSENGWKNFEAFWKTPKEDVMKTWLEMSKEMTTREEQRGS